MKYEKPKLHDLTSSDSGRGRCFDGSSALDGGGWLPKRDRSRYGFPVHARLRRH